MELAKLIAFPIDNVDIIKFDIKDEQYKISIDAIGDEAIEKCKEIIDKYNFDDIEMWTSDDYATDSEPFTIKVLKPEHRKDYEDWKLKQEYYTKKSSELLAPIYEMEYKFLSLCIENPGPKAKDEWWREESFYSWDIYYTKNSELYKELNNLKTRLD